MLVFSLLVIKNYSVFLILVHIIEFEVSFSDDSTYQDESSESLEQVNNSKRRQLGPRTLSSQSVPTAAEISAAGASGLGSSGKITTLTIPVPNLKDLKKTKKSSSNEGAQPKYLNVPREL